MAGLLDFNRDLTNLTPNEKKFKKCVEYNKQRLLTDFHPVNTSGEGYLAVIMWSINLDEDSCIKYKWEVLDKCRYILYALKSK